MTFYNRENSIHKLLRQNIHQKSKKLQITKTEKRLRGKADIHYKEMGSSEEQLVCLSDYERRAKAMVDMGTRDYWATGADGEQTLADNENDFKRYSTPANNYTRILCDAVLISFYIT